MIYYHIYLYMFWASICPSSGVQVVCCLHMLDTNLHTVHKTTHWLLRTTATTPSAEHHMQAAHNLYYWRWAYRCPKHVEIFMTINHNCLIKLVPLVKRQVVILLNQQWVVLHIKLSMEVDPEGAIQGKVLAPVWVVSLSWWCKRRAGFIPNSTEKKRQFWTQACWWKDENFIGN